jgi:hypothetical protein
LSLAVNPPGRQTLWRSFRFAQPSLCLDFANSMVHFTVLGFTVLDPTRHNGPFTSGIKVSKELPLAKK